ncbi:TadE/TadG family type IV pilus assembly protein [Mesorhizobium marinum]|uniref:TadE/TadG family type IV pilus assembly protein n=1 Tax=Mesorhizobium marinum TaxID=3228790 RepID=A0ABV3R1S7_9HYPH
MSVYWAAGILDHARRLRRDRRGVAALEFALIVPLLLMLYFVTMEVAQAIEANKKVGRVGSMVADLVTQQQTMSKTELEGIMRIGEATLQPYNRSAPNIEITAIEVTDEATPKIQVVWSRKLVNGSFSAGKTVGTPVVIPPALRIKGSFLVRADATLAYQPVITWAASAKSTLGLASAFDSIAMSETYYLRPRMSMTIPCSDC